MRPIAKLGKLPATLVVAALVACTGGPGRQLAGESDLFTEVKRYYDRHGMEVAGRCRTPELGGVLRSTVLERDADRLVIRVGYTYNDPNERLLDECRGVGERIFTVARRDGGLEVVEMTGTQHPKGIRIERIDDSDVW
jgi:hypothetical protein